MPSYCGHWGVINRATGEVFPFWCKRGRCECECCKRAFASERIALITELVKVYRLNKFFTLTLPATDNAESQWREISDIWARMRHLLKREGYSIKYVAILEATKRGTPHIHGFTDTWIPQETWSRLWQKAGGGKVVHVEKVWDLVKVGDYVGKQLDIAKYVGKQAVTDIYEHIPKGVKTLWRTKGMRLEKELDRKKEVLYTAINGRVIGKFGICTRDMFSWDNYEYAIYWKVMKNEKKQVGKDVERARFSLFKKSIESSVKVVEGKSRPCERQESFDFESKESENQCRDKERDG